MDTSDTPAATAMLDFNHPLFLHPSDTPGGVLVSHRLVGIKNYNIWSRSMRIALLAKNKLGLVDGTSCKEDYDEILHSQWERCNAFVLSWILNTVSSDLSAGIVFASSAAHVWNDLKDRFDKPLPTVNQAYSMIVQEEAQRAQLSGALDADAMYSNASGNSVRKRFTGVCDYCKLKGHKRENCYRLIGFPPDFKFTKKRNSQAALVSSPSLADSDHESRSGESRTANPVPAPVFTTTQYHQILELLNKTPSADAAVNLAGATDHMVSESHCLQSLTSCEPSYVHLPTGKTIPITHTGSFHFNSIDDLFTGKMRGIGREACGLYLFINTLFLQCSVCPLAKQSRLPFPISSSRSPKPFDLIHVDLWGPYRISTHSGYRSFLTIVDDHTRLSWVYLLRLKSDAILFLKQFFTLVRTHHSVLVKYVRSDNGGEFFSDNCSELFSSLGIVHQSSCVHTPQQNGVAE
ncbi:uncharacterized protein LOC120213937 [Hibiscus syriacus]|uniref:uncharacterized protein LOC120213937 n=1 Tax=Hibiscus syriacus TaxID=106335 RepID=UPI0019228F4E|nr:uncharacterized protein LOC120213937 [Hibiscus syriacus]